MVDIKNIIIPIITLAITLVLGGSGLVDFINSYLNKPSVIIDFMHDNKTTNSTAIIDVTNRGGAPATNLKLTLDAPGKIDDYDVNSTEDYEEVKNSTSLVLTVPRFIHGEGSIIKVGLKLANISTLENKYYGAYATYDQGSLKLIVPAVFYEQLILEENRRQFMNTLLPAITLTGFAILALFSGLMVDRLYKKYRAAQIIGVFPDNGSRDIPTDTFVTATFDKSMDTSNIEFHLEGSNKSIVGGETTTALGNRTILFKPEDVLLPGKSYLATISYAIRAVHGSMRHVAHTWSFTTTEGKKRDESIS